MEKFKWPRDLIKLLIENFKKREHLYNSSHPHYASGKHRKASLHQIYTELKKKNNKVTLHGIKAKLRTIRTQYSKEYRNWILSGKRDEKITLWSYKLLDFLRPYIKTKDAELTNLMDESFQRKRKMEFIEKGEVSDANSDKSNHWTKEQILVLIEQIRKRPLLYDNSFQPRAIQNYAFKTIANELRSIKPDITQELVEVKFRHIQHQFFMETKLLQNVSLNYKQPRLWFYDLCKFMLQSKSSEPEESIPSSEEQEQEILTDDPIGETTYTEVDHSSFETQDQDIGRRILYKKCLNLIETLTKEMHSAQSVRATENRKRSPQTFLGLLVESELMEVSEDIYSDAKWKIIRVLEEASKQERETNGAVMDVECAESLNHLTGQAQKTYKLPPSTSISRSSKVKVLYLNNL